MEIVLSAIAGLLLVARPFWQVMSTPSGRSASGSEAMVGSIAIVDAGDDAVSSARVRVGGERWTARGSAPLVPGARVRIDAVDGLELRVSPAPDAAIAPSPRPPRATHALWIAGLALWAVSIAVAVSGSGSLVGAGIAYVDAPEQLAPAFQEVEPHAMVAVPRMFEVMANVLPRRIETNLPEKSVILQKLVPMAIRMGQKNLSDRAIDRIQAKSTNAILGPIRKKVS